MNSNNEKKKILDQLNAGMDNLSNLSNVAGQYIGTSKKPEYKLSTFGEKHKEKLKTNKEIITEDVQMEEGYNDDNTAISGSEISPLKTQGFKINPIPTEILTNEDYEMNINHASNTNKKHKRLNPFGDVKMSSDYQQYESVYNPSGHEQQNNENFNKRGAKFSEKEKKREEKINKNNSQQR